MEMLKDLEQKGLGIEVEGTWCGGLLYVKCGGDVCNEVEI